MSDRRPQSDREVAQQGVLQLVLLTGALLLVNRYVRDLAWDESLWRSLQFAVPFTVVYTAIAVYMQRQRRDDSR